MSVLDRFGVDARELPVQFEQGVFGRTLIMDGDSACYAATADAKRLETAYRRFHTAILEKMILTKSETARVHLTPKGCLKNNRDLYLGSKPYQANRLNKDKPPLLELLRAGAVEYFKDHEEIEVFAHFDIEADDAVMRDSYMISNGVVYSEDKDLQIVPGLLYNHKTGIVQKLDNRYGWVKLDESGSNTKIVGHGTKFFWAQMLMGDQADNVKGIEKYNGKLCGVAAAYKVLGALATENDAANAVLDGYRAIDQNPLPEAECLWLSRMAGDSASSYIWSLDLTERNREFVLTCFNRKYKMDDSEFQSWGDILGECTSVKEVQHRWEAFKRTIL